jgi:hypothetical protein
MAWSSGCSRIPKPETKGGPGDEDAFEDGLGNRNARLEEGPALHGTSGSLPGGPESGIPTPLRCSGVRGTERTSVERSTMGKSAELESGARPMTPALLLRKSQKGGSHAWKEDGMAIAKRRKRSGGASGQASVRGGSKARTPFLRAGTQDHGTSWVPKVHRVVD